MLEHSETRMVCRRTRIRPLRQLSHKCSVAEAQQHRLLLPCSGWNTLAPVMLCLLVGTKHQSAPHSCSKALHAGCPYTDSRW